MNGYTIVEASEELNVSKDALFELRAKLVLKKKVGYNKKAFTEAEFEKLKEAVTKIMKVYDKVTLSTINDYMKYKG